MTSVLAVVILVVLLIAGLMAMVIFIQANRHNPDYAWPGWMRRLPGMGHRAMPLATSDFDNPVRFENANDFVTFGEASASLA